MWDKIETYLVVTFITALVWLYADGENIKPHTVALSVRLVPPPGQTLVIQPGGPVKVQATVRASQAQLSQLKDLTREAIPIDVSEDAQNVSQTIALRDRLTRESPFADLGITISELEPATVTATVESLVEVPAEVRVAMPPEVELAPSIVVEPVRVTVRLPRSLAAVFNRNAVIEARLSGLNFNQFEANVAHTVEVPLALPGGVSAARATLDPPTAKITFTVRKLSETFTISSVPVWVLLSPLEVKRFDVSVDQLFLRDVVISGPSDVVKRIRDGQIDVLAVLRLRADDLEKGINSAQPIVNVPTGVTVETPIPRVGITVTPR
jgi:hypothetical protein